MTHCLRYESVGSRQPGFVLCSRRTIFCALTFNRRVVLVDEVALDELDGQARLSHTTAAYYHQLVFSEKLRRRQQGSTARETGGLRTLDAMVLCRVEVGQAADVGGEMDRGATEGAMLRGPDGGGGKRGRAGWLAAATIKGLSVAIES
jgi:hypothetical protein